MFNKKLEKRVKCIEDSVGKIAEQIGIWARFYDGSESEVGDGMSINHNEIKIADVVRAIVTHLDLCVGVKAVEKPKKK